jgi:hypothetical protein
LKVPKPLNVNVEVENLAAEASWQNCLETDRIA